MCVHIHRTLRREFMIGNDGLDATYNGFFAGTMAALLRKDDVTKLQWLHSVWIARDAYREANGMEPWERDGLAATFLQRHRMRLKRKIRY